MCRAEHAELPLPAIATMTRKRAVRAGPMPPHRYTTPHGTTRGVVLRRGPPTPSPNAKHLVGD
jgi:hypothetical protein